MNLTQHEISDDLEYTRMRKKDKCTVFCWNIVNNELWPRPEAGSFHAKLRNLVAYILLPRYEINEIIRECWRLITHINHGLL